VRFYVNGKQTFSYARVPGKESEGQFPFARPYMLRIDMQLGGKWVGEVKPFTDPVRMYVDWVRFYQKK
jgi:licheninase